MDSRICQTLRVPRQSRGASHWAKVGDVDFRRWPRFATVLGANPGRSFGKRRREVCTRVDLVENESRDQPNEAANV